MQAKAGEREVRGCKIGGVKLAGIAEESVEFSFFSWTAEKAVQQKAVVILIPDCSLGNLICSKNVL